MAELNSSDNSISPLRWPQQQPKHVVIYKSVNKIHHKLWSAFCWLFKYYGPDQSKEDRRKKNKIKHVSLLWCIFIYLAFGRAFFAHPVYTYNMYWVVGHAVAQLVEALRYKSEGRGFDSRWCQWSYSFRPHCGPGVDSASNRNEYHEYFLVVEETLRRADNLTTFMCRLSWNVGASTSRNPQGLSRPVMGLIYLCFFLYVLSCTSKCTSKYRICIQNMIFLSWWIET